jgi:hypothetical protein
MTRPTAQRQRRGWDVALSIVFMVFAVVSALVAGFLQLFLVAFTDVCPPATCHEDLGFTELSIIWIVVLTVLVASILLSIVFLITRRRAWWIALIGLAVVLLGSVLGVVLYYFAVGGG